MYVLFLFYLFIFHFLIITFKSVSFYYGMCSRSMVVVLRSAVKSSHPEVFCKKRVLRNFAKFSGKHLWQSLFFEVGLSPSKKIVICLIKSPLKMMKNAFYFILKALFVLKINNFCLDFLIM